MKATETQTARELAAVLDRIDQEEEDMRSEVKERKDRIAALRSRARELRDLLTGRKGAQGVIGATLAEAAEVGRRKGDA